MDTQNLQLIINQTDMIATKLGVAAGHIWPILLKQARINSITDTVVIIVAIMVSSMLLWLSLKENDRSHDCDTGLIIIGAVIGVITLICVLACCEGIVAGFLNPDFAAMQILAALINAN